MTLRKIRPRWEDWWNRHYQPSHPASVRRLTILDKIADRHDAYYGPIDQDLRWLLKRDYVTLVRQTHGSPTSKRTYAQMTSKGVIAQLARDLRVETHRRPMRDTPSSRKFTG